MGRKKTTSDPIVQEYRELDTFLLQKEEEVRKKYAKEYTRRDELFQLLHKVD